MIYVLDTSAFIELKHFYPTAFPTIWSRLETMMHNGDLWSVLEVWNELNNYNEADLIVKWAKRHKSIFAKPSNDELLVVQQIMAIPHFQALVGGKAMLTGKPVADPFVVAAAAVKGGTVVTQERFKPNAAKIPNVCAHFGVPCVTLEGFITGQGWRF